jgi:hypothetical protein
MGGFYNEEVTELTNQSHGMMGEETMSGPIGNSPLPGTGEDSLVSARVSEINECQVATFCI